MNKNQKVILAAFIPIIIFFITLTIAYYISVEVVITPGYSTSVPTDPNMDPNLARLIRLVKEPGPDWQPGDPIYRHHPAITNKYYDPFDWGKTWYVWFLFLIFCFIFAYKLFADKKIKGRRIKNGG